jgi:hypothetical protein
MVADHNVDNGTIFLNPPTSLGDEGETADNNSDNNKVLDANNALSEGLVLPDVPSAT